MKRLFLLLTCIIITCTPALRASTDVLTGLVTRLLPGHEAQFAFAEEIAPDSADYFEISASDGKVLIKGNSPVSIATGLGWYLKYTCKASTSWCGDQLKLPRRLPLPATTIRRSTRLPVGFYLNYCTYGYSMPFWGWKEWEREIDRMALNGINTPLAVTGIESVWRATLRRFGYKDEEIKAFLPGPTYTGWFLMDNLEGYGGPLSDTWIARQEALQKRIVGRMRAYGMTPVFQSFFGMVPATLQQKFPKADIVAQGKWNGFDRPPMLNPSDTLFGSMAKAWYEEYARLYGTTRYYGGDPFHEGGIPGHIDLTEAARHIQGAMQSAVPGSTWVLQAWGENPTEKLLTGTDRSHVMVVDLCAEYWNRWYDRKAFGGCPWVWADITNWGGNIALHGRLDAIASGPARARRTAFAAPLLRGTGNVPEGMGTNPVAFDMACEMRWRDSISSVDEWLHGYADYRYGRSDEVLHKAWEMLHSTAYGTYKEHRRPTESVLCAVPSLNVTHVSPSGSTHLYYNQADFRKAVKLFASVASRYKGCDTYEHDLVDFTRQLVANEGRIAYTKAIEAYKKGLADSVNYFGNTFLHLILLQDRLLACRPEFCVSKWIQQARDADVDTATKRLFEHDARALITTWGDGNHTILDYGHREWNGLLKEYYYPRWVLFFHWLEQTTRGEKLPEPDYSDVESEWIHSTRLPAPQKENLHKVVKQCLETEVEH